MKDTVLLSGVRNLLGVDRAVAYTLVGRFWSLGAGAVTIFLVTTHFSPAIQGYHYTFASLVSIQTLVELGFGSVLVQFVSHEWAHLGLNENNQIEGETRALLRLGSLVRLGLLWYLALSAIFFILVGGLGQAFLLQRRDVGLDIVRPWWFLCFAFAFTIMTLPMRCLLEGSNQVARARVIDLNMSIFSSIAGWIAILGGGNLYAIGIIATIRSVVGVVMLVPAAKPFFKIMSLKNDEHRISWRRDFWPQQWRIGISWLSGFFMFQIFVPLTFQLRGAVAAGQMGVTVQIFNMVNSIAYAWPSAVAPQMGILGAHGDFVKLRSVVRRTYARSLLVSVACAVGVLSVISSLHAYNLPQASRFADLFSTLLFMISVVGLQLPNVETQAIRFQKREPFVANSLVSALLVLVLGLILGYLLGIRGIAAGFCAVMVLITIPWCHRIYATQMNTLAKSYTCC